MSKVGQIHQEEPSYKGQFTIACRQYTLYKSKRKKTKKMHIPYYILGMNKLFIISMFLFH